MISIQLFLYGREVGLMGRIIIWHKKKKYCGICGDAPSTFPDFFQFLVDSKIPTISLSPDVVIKTILSFSKNKISKVS